MRRFAPALLLPLTLVAAATARLAAAEAPVAPRAAVLERHAPAIVRVEAVLKTRFNMGGEGEEQDSRLDLMGAIVDPGGLIMVWNSNISSARLREMMEAMSGGAGWEVEVTPTDFQVLLPGSTRQARAFLAATDSNLDLAFLQLVETPEAPLPYVDFAASEATAVGEEVLSVTRLPRAFDHAPVVASARIAGRVAKPRPAWAVDGTLATYGLPVFSLAGAPVGALTTVFSRLGDDAGPMGGFGQMMGAAGSGPLGTFVLPGDRVAVLVDLARKEAARLLEARRAALEEEGAAN